MSMHCDSCGTGSGVRAYAVGLLWTGDGSVFHAGRDPAGEPMHTTRDLCPACAHRLARLARAVAMAPTPRQGPGGGPAAP
jgi:hypothetical protein